LVRCCRFILFEEEGFGRMPRERQRIELKVNDPRGCPIFSAGDRMVVDPPEVIAGESDAVCMYAVTKLVSSLVGISREGGCRGFLLPGDMKEMNCPRLRDGAVFEVAVLPESEMFVSLAKVPIFASLSADQVRAIAKVTSLHDYKRGETVIRRGQRGEHLFVVLEGSVDVIREGKEGTESAIARLGQNDCFGEMSLLTGEPCSATVRAASTLKLMSLHRGDFERLLDESLAISRALFTVLAQRLRKSNALLEEAIEQGMVGKLSVISLPELVQAISVGRRTGVLHLNYKTSKGRAFFESGSVVDCGLDTSTGVEAFYELLRWPDGEFRFEQRPMTGERRITVDTMWLLMEGMRRLDERRQASAG